MLKRVGVVVVWVLATLGTASLTYAAVSRAGGAVGDAPAVPVAAADIAARVPTTATTSQIVTTTTSDVTPTTSEVTVTTTGTPSSGSTTTTTPGTTTSTTPITTGQQTTTTQPSIRTEWKTVGGVGTVGVSVQGDRLALVSATPVAPFHVEGVETEGDSIEVEFKSESAEYRIRAEVKNGVLVWDVEDHD